MLERALQIAQSDLGPPQLADLRTKELWMAAQQGHTEAFLDFFDQVRSDRGSACALAAARTQPVTVLDVTADPGYTDASRAAMLASGSRSCESIPITAPDGRLLGIVSPTTACRSTTPSTRRPSRQEPGSTGSTTPSS